MLGLLNLTSKVVTVSLPTLSLRETYIPLNNLSWSIVKLATFIIKSPFINIFINIFINYILLQITPNYKGA